MLESLKETKSEDMRILSIVAEKDRTIRNLKRTLEDLKSVCPFQSSIHLIL